MKWSIVPTILESIGKVMVLVAVPGLVRVDRDDQVAQARVTGQVPVVDDHLWGAKRAGQEGCGNRSRREFCKIAATVAA